MPKDVVSRDFTINLHKRLHAIGAKKRAPRAIKAVRAFAALNMGVPAKDVSIHADLNKAIWAQGIASPAMRLRVRLSRVRKTEEGKTNRFRVIASHVVVPRDQLRHLKTVTVEEEAQ